MDIRSIRKLIEIVEQSDIAEIEIKEGESNIRISRSKEQVMVSAPAAPIAAAAIPAAPAAPVATPAETTAAPSPVAEEISGTQVTSPMVGSFYSSSSPDADPFIKVGDQVAVGDTLCIIEAMKIMNPIEAEVAGTITRILVQNADPVEFGQTLFVIE
jgi:acetyl-CoA carboxylase biotin carboxyl carrier protein